MRTKLTKDAREKERGRAGIIPGHGVMVRTLARERRQYLDALVPEDSRTPLLGCAAGVCRGRAAVV